MKKTGITFVELLVTVALSVIVAIAVVVTGINSLKASSATDKKVIESAQLRNAVAALSNQVYSSNLNYITIKNCGNNECVGKKLIFKGPVVDLTPVAHSVYTPDGRVKYGADGKQNCRYEYYVNSQNDLILEAKCADGSACTPSCAGGYCGDGICQDTETGISCLIDCGTCGDGKCTPERGEDLNNCADCAICGDFICSLGETCSTCAADCGVCRSNSGGGSKKNPNETTGGVTQGTSAG